MQPSPELRAITQHIFELLAAHNAPAVMALCSGEPGGVFLGTAPTEWYESLAALEPMIQQVASESSGNMPADLQVQAMQEGSMGWAAFRYTGKLPNGAVIHLRGTNVFHQENGAWKIVHTHLSVAIPDELVPNIAQPAG